MSRDKPLDPKTLRVFGSLKDVVHFDTSFFEPLPVDEQTAWESDPDRGSSQSKKAAEAPNASEQANDPTP